MLRFGIVGTNFISEWFAGACRALPDRVQVAAVHSRTLAKAEQFASEHCASDQGVAQGVDDLDALFELVDAVYIASPNRAHHPQAMAALAAGKHVLVEKTIGSNLAQATEIVEVARANGLVAMEAMRTVHAPTHALIRDALPRLGTIRHARFEKLQYSSRYDSFREGTIQNAFDPSLDNSALADIGIYCLQPALDLFGEPVSVTGRSVHLHNGFEGGGSMLLEYPDAVVDLAWSKIAPGAGLSMITGEDGWLSFDDPGEPRTIRLGLRGQDPVTLFEATSPKPQDQMSHEVAAFCDQVERGQLDERWAQLSLLSRRLMDDHLAR